MAKVKNRSKPKKCFDPLVIATTVREAVIRDLGSPICCVGDTKDPAELYASRQTREFLKKFTWSKDQRDVLEAKTFEKFLNVNAHMSKFRDMKFPETTARVQSWTSAHEKILIRARALMHFVLSDFTEDEWFLECRNSGGSSLGVSFKDTSVEAKFKFPLTCTARVKSLFDRYLNFDSLLRLAIMEHNGHGSTDPVVEIVEGSRATTVEKNDEIRRMIAVEPTLNMFFQQGLMSMLYRRMKVVGLNVERLPDAHRQLALESSITASNATIDFSSASDCVSIELLRWLLPPRWFYVVDRVRSPLMAVKGQLVDLNMIATMGNAVTFPLETLVFWTLAHAVRLTRRPGNDLFPEWEDLNRCSVFGDDCIVPSEDADLFIQTAESLGFLVNTEKSFTKPDGFRESCGGDYLLGYNVRPFYLKAPSSDRQSALEPWLYVIANGLLKKYMSYFGTTNYIYSKALWTVLFDLFNVHKIRIKLVPSYFPDDAGLKMSFDIDRLLLCYPMKLSRITCDKHGTYRFAYMRFQYRERYEQDAFLRYSLWLKNPSHAKGAKRLIVSTNSTRRVGGYVVGKGVSPCFGDLSSSNG